MATRLMGIDVPPVPHRCDLPDAEDLKDYTVVMCEECGDRWKLMPPLTGIEAVVAVLTFQNTGRTWVGYYGSIGEGQSRGIKLANLERERRPI